MVSVYNEHTVIVQLKSKMFLSYSWNPILISNFSLSALLFPVETETREKDGDRDDSNTEKEVIFSLF